ncbi:MAG: helix-hairpin-helix domain-containing protein [Saprospiraceae bacterium]
MRNNTQIYFTRQERKSLFIFSMMAFAFLAMMYAIASFKKPDKLNLQEVIKVETMLPKTMAAKPTLAVNINNIKHHSSRLGFHFNPNTISADSLALLGVDKKTISNFLKYRSKGAVFKNNQQFFKVYGMEKYRVKLDTLLSCNQSPKLEIQAKDGQQRQTQNDGEEIKKSNRTIPVVKIKMLDINKADSFELQLIRGIGAKLASRIVRYRERLGGFNQIEQLEEIYGLTPETYLNINHQLTLDQGDIQKILINKCNEEQMARHPYIGKKKASILMRFKINRGNFHQWQDLISSKLFDDEELEKLKPYIDFSE